MAGASEAGEDFSVGRTNESEERSLLIAINGDPDGYQTDYVLTVASANNKILTKNPDGVDAIHAVGTEALPTGGAIGTIPEGNGVVAQGLNGAVGYVHAAPRDKFFERNVRAGLLGVGGAGSPGVFGQGLNGVVGYGGGAVRDTGWEAAEATGIAGNALGIGVRGKGDNGGVRGESTNAGFGVEGTSQLGVGVHGRSSDGTGVLGESDRGDGVTGSAGEGVGGVFQSRRSAQLWLIPNDTDLPTQSATMTPSAISPQDRGMPLPANGRAGQLIAATTRGGEATLWFCVNDGPPARWAQVLLGHTFPGTA